MLKRDRRNKQRRAITYLSKFINYTIRTLEKDEVVAEYGPEISS